MIVDTTKLLFLKGSTAARTAKVGFMPEPTEKVVDLDETKLLVLKGSTAARAAKVGMIMEPLEK